MNELANSNAFIAIVLVAVFVILYLLADYWGLIKRLEDIPHEWQNEKEAKTHFNTWGDI